MLKALKSLRQQTNHPLSLTSQHQQKYIIIIIVNVHLYVQLFILTQSVNARTISRQGEKIPIIRTCKERWLLRGV